MLVQILEVHVCHFSNARFIKSSSWHVETVFDAQIGMEALATLDPILVSALPESFQSPSGVSRYCRDCLAEV